MNSRLAKGRSAGDRGQCTGIQAATGAGLKVIGFLDGSHILPGHGERLLELGASGLVEGFQGLGEFL